MDRAYLFENEDELKNQIAENSKVIDQLLEELKDFNMSLEKANV